MCVWICMYIKAGQKFRIKDIHFYLLRHDLWRGQMEAISRFLVPKFGWSIPGNERRMRALCIRVGFWGQVKSAQDTKERVREQWPESRVRRARQGQFVSSDQATHQKSRVREKSRFITPTSSVIKFSSLNSVPSIVFLCPYGITVFWARALWYASVECSVATQQNVHNERYPNYNVKYIMNRCASSRWGSYVTVGAATNIRLWNLFP